MNDEFDYKFELLKQEMETLQNGIRTYDSNLFTIKGWAVTIFSTAVYFSIQARQPIYLMLGAMSVLLFWMIDAVFKAVQRIYILRYNKIEQYLQSPRFAQAVANHSFKDFIIPDVGSGFHLATKKYWPAILQAAISLPTVLLYVAMLVLIAGLAIGMLIWGP